MKYIKTYENFDNPRLQDLKDLLNYLTKTFNELGYDHKGYLDMGKYEVQFSDNKTDYKRCFNLEGEYSTSGWGGIRAKIFLSIVMRIGSLSDGLVKFIPAYFKTINGLELYREDSDFYNTTFEIVGNLNDITEQITVEDIKMKFDSNKYNL